MYGDQSGEFVCYLIFGLIVLSWFKSPYFCRELQKESNTQSPARGQSWCFRMWPVWEDKSYAGRVTLYFYSVYMHLKGCCCFFVVCLFVCLYFTSLCINLLKTNSRSAFWISVNTSLFQYAWWLKPTFCGTSNGFPTKWHLRNEHRNSILMACHYLDLGGAVLLIG